jgi:hypothetical protein
MYNPPQPLDGQPWGDLFSAWKNEKVAFVLGEPIAGMLQRNELPAGTVKWTADNVAAKENVAEYEVQFTTTGLKQVHLQIGGTTYDLRINVPDTGALNRDDDALLQQVGILAMGTATINGISARDRVQLKYGVDAAHGGTRQDAIRHSTWNAITAQAIGENFTRLITTANERTGQYQGAALASNTTMDLHNNGVGIDAGKLLFGTNTPMTTDDWIARMEVKFDNAELWAWTPPNATVSTHSSILRKSTQAKIYPP